MKALHLDNDKNRLYFTNYDLRPDDEEYKEIISILKTNNCTIAEPIICPDCDMIDCSIDSVKFTLIRTIDGDGSFIYCETTDGMKRIEKMFDMLE